MPAGFITQAGNMTAEKNEFIIFYLALDQTEGDA